MGSLPFRKTSLTKFGQSAVGNMPEGSQTLITETSEGTGQPSRGKFCEAVCMRAFHNTAGTRGDKSPFSRAPVHAATTRDGEYPIAHVSSAPSLCPNFTAAGLPTSSPSELRSISERTLSSLNACVTRYASPGVTTGFACGVCQSSHTLPSLPSTFKIVTGPNVSCTSCPK